MIYDLIVFSCPILKILLALQLQLFINVQHKEKKYAGKFSI